MTLDQLQSATKALLDAHAFFSGFTWAINDDTSDQRAAINTAFAAAGIYGVIQRAQSADTTRQNRKLVDSTVWLPLTITESPEKNRVDGGFGNSAERCIEECMKALIDNTQTTQVGTYMLAPQGWKYTGFADGAHHHIINFIVKLSTSIT